MLRFDISFMHIA